MHTFDVISRYCNDEMSTSERVAFETDLLSNTHLKEEVSLYKNLERVSRADSLKNVLSNISQERMAKERTTPSKSIRLLWLSGALLLLATLSYFLVFKKKEPTPIKENHEALFAQLYKHENIATMGEGYTGLDVPQSAVQAYNNSDFETAINLLNTHLQNNPMSDDAVILVSKCYIESNDFSKAESVLKSIGEQSAAYQSAKWLQALVYLKTGQLEACRNTLNGIVQAKKAHYKDAEELLRRI